MPSTFVSRNVIPDIAISEILCFNYFLINGKSAEKDIANKLLCKLNSCSDFFQILSNYWKRNNWDLDEIKTICYALDVCCPCLNPHYFLNQKLAYIEHINTCYLVREI